MHTITIAHIPNPHEGFTEYIVKASCDGFECFGNTADQAIGRLVSDHSAHFGIELSFIPPNEVSNAFQR